MTENLSTTVNAPLNIEGYAYRTSARFGSRVWLTISDTTLTVTGPRLSKSLYRYWIGVQLFFLLATFGFILTAFLTQEWRWLWIAALSLGINGCAGGFGAGCLWEMSNLIAFGNGVRGDSVTFPLDQIKRVSIGRGWARRGMKLLLLPYYFMMNQTTANNVNFEGPDGTDSQGVYAIHMRNHAEAERLAAALRAKIESSQEAAQPI